MSSSGERNFLQERSVAEIVKSAFWLYGAYFRKIFPSYFVLLFPAYILSYIASKFRLGFLVSWIIIQLTSTVASVVITIVVSDICLGEAPNLKRAWKHLSAGLLGRLLVTNLLFDLLVGLCFIVLLVLALVVPTLMPPLVSSWIGSLCWFVAGLLFVAFLTCFVFVPTIVILENRWGFRAMMRSVKLGYGFHFRNLIVVCLMLAVIFVGPLTLFYWFSRVRLTDSAIVGEAIVYLVYYLVGCLIQPLAVMYIVLMYYDIRVRKEAYDNAALAEDLRH